MLANGVHNQFFMCDENRATAVAAYRIVVASYQAGSVCVCEGKVEG